MASDVKICSFSNYRSSLFFNIRSFCYEGLMRYNAIFLITSRLDIISNITLHPRLEN